MEDKYREYEKRKLNYKADLIRYQEALARWNTLSEEEKAAECRAAEGTSLLGWSLVVSVGAGFLLYKYLSEQLTGDVFWISWAGATFLVAAIAVALHQLVGRVARGAAFTLVFGVICWFVMAMLRENVSNPPSEFLQYIVTGTGAAIGAVGEALGWYHASGAPNPPSAPQMPL